MAKETADEGLQAAACWVCSRNSQGANWGALRKRKSVLDEIRNVRRKQILQVLQTL